jgi:hypothetical protein
MPPRLTQSFLFLLSGLSASSFLVVLILVRYPAGASSKMAYLGGGFFALILMLAVAAFVGWCGARLRSPEQAADTRLGMILGLVAGCAWVLEISFNNFVDPRVSTASARYFVDNGTWVLIGFALLITSFVRSLHAGQVVTAIRVGLWSGLTSGLISCLMGLLLLTVWMPFLLRDPLNIEEYAIRGIAEHSPDMATYFAYETMNGAVGHLIVLGIAMGLILGTIGGLLAQLVALVQSRL